MNNKKAIAALSITVISTAEFMHVTLCSDIAQVLQCHLSCKG